MTQRSERGSVLMLMPAAVLIMIVLGSICVDFTVVYLGEREAASLATAAANDAVTAALNEELFRERGEFRIRERLADRIARDTVGASSSEIDDLDVDVEITNVAGEPAVTVTVRGTVEYVFAKAIPGAHERAEVEASATAVARAG